MCVCWGEFGLHLEDERLLLFIYSKGFSVCQDRLRLYSHLNTVKLQDFITHYTMIKFELVIVIVN